jgi:hypothetical protein
MYNAHVALFYRFLCWLAEKERRPMAQMHYYTCAMKENDPGWKP